MKFFVGIDLGTTNSAISTFDGTEVRLRKFFPPARKLRDVVQAIHGDEHKI